MKLSSAAIAGFTAAAFSLPFDMLKSRLQASQVRPLKCTAVMEISSAYVWCMVVARGVPRRYDTSVATTTIQKTVPFPLESCGRFLRLMSFLVGGGGGAAVVVIGNSFPWC